jgi:hypothetical protein
MNDFFIKEKINFEKSCYFEGKNSLLLKKKEVIIFFIKKGSFIKKLKQMGP